MWEPEGNLAFIEALKKNLKPGIPFTELDAHINDPEFIDPVVETFLSMMKKESLTPSLSSQETVS
jgi:uncharacterized protein (UPF0261 family)